MTPFGKPTGGLIALAALALGGIVGARYLSTRKISAAERLCDALLDTEPLREAARDLTDRPDARLCGLRQIYCGCMQPIG